jgi:sigma-B regulation protein RsbU (phosphoserine phosphatase)
MCILVVDDSADAREIAQAALETSGLDDLAFATSGKDALRFLGVEPYGEPDQAVDVILLDVVMPRIDGIEACARLRADERYADIPVLMVTGERDLDSLVQAFMAGANDYVNKPFNQIELAARVRGALRLKGELDRRKAREEELLNLHASGAGAGLLMSGFGGITQCGPIDAATGCVSRAVVDEALAVWSIRGKPAAGIMAVHIDSYSSLRQQDYVSARVVQALLAVRSRLGALFAPYGNGLFIVVVPDLTRDEADTMADLFHRQVATIGFPKGVGSVSISVSVGLPFAGIRDDPRQILVEAVEALSSAGSGGETIIV